MKVTFISNEGESRSVEAKPGQTLLQAAQNNLVPGFVADCGGNCSCATCHAYIDKPWFKLLPKPSENEGAMIECALHVKPNSRLACQVILTRDLDGMVVHIPESQM